MSSDPKDKVTPLDYAPPAEKSRTQWWFVSLGLGTMCLLIEFLSELVTVVPYKNLHRDQMIMRVTLLLLAGLFFVTSATSSPRRRK